MSVMIEEEGSRTAVIHRIGKKAKSTCEVKFKGLGAVTDLEIHAACNAYFTANRFYRIAPYVFLIDHYQVENIGYATWDITGHYETMGADKDDTPMRRVRTFDVSGETKTMTSAFSERAYAAAGTTAPSMSNAIEVDGDNVRGVEVPAKSLVWTEQYDMPAQVMTKEYILDLRRLNGCVNKKPFRGFEAEEVLFLGAQGSQQWDEEKGDGPATLTFKFKAGFNSTSEFIGNITGIEKKAHEYLWVVYADDIKDDSRVKVPLYVYVNQIHIPADFDLLRIGNA